MRLLEPQALEWLLAAVVAIALWGLYRRLKARFRHNAAISGQLVDASRLSTSFNDAMLLVTALLAIGLLVLAMARPQLFLEIQIPQYERHDLVLMLDRSVSMYARDVKPNRFTRAIEEIKTFVSKKPDGIDRVALLGFAGTPLVLSRFTADQSSLFFYLDWMKDDERIFFGTDIGAVLKSAVELVQKDGASSPKIFVVLSDGEDRGTTLTEALEGLRQQGTRVHTIGIGGDAEVPIVVREQGKTVPLLDERGNVMTTRFSPATLTSIASLTGGRYYRSIAGTELIAAMTDIESFERKLVGWSASSEYRDVYSPILMIGALCLTVLLIKL